MDATDQQARWAETIKDLKEAESFLAPFEVVKPFYRRSGGRGFTSGVTVAMHRFGSGIGSFGKRLGK